MSTWKLYIEKVRSSTMFVTARYLHLLDSKLAVGFQKNLSRVVEMLQGGVHPYRGRVSREKSGQSQESDFLFLVLVASVTNAITITVFSLA